jgi:cytochrome bd-type quinol oxidase subunit 2
MAKRTYFLTGLLALLIMIYLIWSHPHINHTAFVWMITLIYVAVLGSVHGAVAHSLSARQKRSQVVYPVFMGALYAVLAYVYLYIVLPLIIPGFF